MDNALDFKQVSIGYQRQHPIIEDISFSLAQGSFLGLIGPNGGGKSTLIKTILGLIPLLSGELRVLGEAKLPHERIGYVPQYCHAPPNFPITLEKMVCLDLHPAGKFRLQTARSVKKKVAESLERVEISHLAKIPLEELSGGQLQRAFIARALIKNPDLLLLDEPVSGVDHLRSREFYQLLGTLKGKMTIILVSHDLGVIPSLVDQIACVNRNFTLHTDPQMIQSHQALEKAYACELELLIHGDVPHRVIKKHSHD